MSDIDMSPDGSPSGGGRRVGDKPMYIFAAVLCAFLIIIALVANDRSNKQNQPQKEKEKKTGNTNAFAQEVAGEQTTGLIPALVVPEQPAAIQIPVSENLNRPPEPPASSGQLQRTPLDEELARIRQAKLEQLQNAIKAKTTVEVTATRSSGASGASAKRDDVLAKMAAVRQQLDAVNAGNTASDPTTVYKDRLKQIQALQGGAGEGNSGSTPNNNYEQFAGTEQADRWELNSKIEAPRSPYELRAGFVLPATLISGINSELPGQIMAQVSQTVFDTATGKWKLIPQGSRLVGSYSSSVSYGQSRVLIAWQRIIFPDGKAMDIGAMPGADSAGYAGFTDQVNNHFLRLYGSAVLMSAVTAGFTISQPQATSTVGTATQQTASSALSQALGQQLGQVTTQMIAKNLTTAPTLEIRPGYRFNVIVTKDLTFSKPYQAFDY